LATAAARWLRPDAAAATPRKPESGPQAPQAEAAGQAADPVLGWRRAGQGRIFGGVATRWMPGPVNIAMNCAVSLEFAA
jgi:hypothetical protein